MPPQWPILTQRTINRTNVNLFKIEHFWLNCFQEDFWRILGKNSIILNLLPLTEDMALHLNKIKSPSPSDALCKVRLKSAWGFRRRRWKCERFRYALNTEDNDTQRINFNQKSLLELSTQARSNVEELKKFNEFS